MKGLTHTIMGVAAASCIPGVVEAASRGTPTHFLLAAAAGLMPDVLDFKVTRFLARTDAVITPDPLDPDPDMIAGGVADALEAAAAGSPVTLRLNTVPLSAGVWRRYTVMIHPVARFVRVRIGAPVNAGACPVGAEPEPPREAVIPLTCRVRQDYLATLPVEIFDGPVIRFEPAGEGTARVVFIPWHRQWTHSLVTALVAGAAAGAAWDWRAGLAVAGAWALHALADHAGHLGSNLLAPFTRRRAAGLRLMRAMDPVPNFACVWGSGALILWNLWMQAAGGATPGNVMRYLVFGVAAPILLFSRLSREAGEGEGD